MPDEDKTFSGFLNLDLRIWWRHVHNLYFGPVFRHSIQTMCTVCFREDFLKSLDISKQRSTVFRMTRGVFFRGHSRITSDCRVCSILKTLSGASRNCSEFVYWSWRSKWIGHLQQTITWYKIRHGGGQPHYYSRTGTLKERDLNQSSVTGLCFNVPVRE